MIRGVWLKTGVNLLIVAVYTPYDLRDKRMLWDYLVHVINQCDGEVVSMGDFNESDYGSVPFGFFHHWTELEGFNKIFIDTWSEAPDDDSSAMRSMMRKLKNLKVKIQEWNNGN
nr:RNA-directed DNA polymerase, eukaryota [Tanacetum cinerariifolium]